MIKLALSILFLGCFLFSCVKPGLNYPYAENNTTTDSMFGVFIKDDYKWLEIDNPANEKRSEWLAAQKQLTNKFFGAKNPKILDRISELSEMPNYIPIEIRNSKVYYLKANIYSNKTQLFAFDLDKKEECFIADLGYSLRALSQIKATLSPDEKKIAVINAFNDTQTNLLIYDLSQSTANAIEIPHVKHYKPFWYKNRLIYTEDGLAANSYGNRVCFFDPENKKTTLIYEDELNNIFKPLDLTINEQAGILYVSGYKGQKKYTTQAINLESPNQIREVISFDAFDSLSYRAAGSDDEHLFYVIYDDKFKAKIYSYNLHRRKLQLMENDSTRPFSYLFQIKDHLIASYNDMVNNKAVLISLKDSTRKQINVSKNGIPTFFNNKNGYEILFMEESLIQSKVLMSSTIEDPSKVNVVASSKFMPFDPDLFESKHVRIDSDNGHPINLMISYRKGLVLDGNNPVIIYSYPNLNLRESNSFYFSRILFMEQGFVFVQRSPEDYKRYNTLKEKQQYVKTTIDYLVKNKYTNPDKLCLSGFEYGSTIFANLLNEDPGICRVALLTNGVYDMLNHAKKDKLKNNNQRFFEYHTKEQLMEVVKKSPYHAVRWNQKYPAVLVLDGEGHKGIDPAHSYKYVAKLQMRTDGSNPILLYDQPKMRREDDMLVFDYREKIYYTISFFSDIIGLKLTEDNFAYPGK